MQQLLGVPSVGRSILSGTVLQCRRPPLPAVLSWYSQSAGRAVCTRCSSHSPSVGNGTPPGVRLTVYLGSLRSADMDGIGVQEVHAAQRRIQQHVHCTPVITNRYLDRCASRQLFFKAENLQKTGSFKARGACNCVSS